jgi:hypothetical protein
MSARTGIKLGSYRKLERGKVKNPPLRWIINCSIVLDCYFGDIWEPSWNEWLNLDGAKEPTDAARRLWKFESKEWEAPSTDLLDRRPPFPSRDETADG